MTIEQIIVFFVLPAAGYLLGAIPFALLIGFSHGVDIRKAGSGNIGATNLGRVLGRTYFFQAFVLDSAKGTIPTVVAALLTQRWQWRPDMIAQIQIPASAPLLTAVACVLGHMFPIYLGFKGGKGVATSLGVVLGLWPVGTLSGVGGLAVFIIVFFGWRYVSLASIVAAVCFAALVAVVGQWRNPWVQTYQSWSQLWPLVAVSACLSAMIIVRHRSNIVRLMNGTEQRWGEKKSDPA